MINRTVLISASRTIRGVTRLPAHVLLETYSVLTRLPPPHRAPPEVVAAYLSERFPHPPHVLRASSYARLVEAAARGSISGGAVYDAFVATTVAEARETLLTMDRRAAAVYETVGVKHRFVT